MAEHVVSEPAPAPAREEGGTWFADERGVERRLRVSWHGERRLFVLSIWQKDTCTATFRLPVGEVPRMIGALAQALGSALSDRAGGTAVHRRRGRTP